MSGAATSRAMNEARGVDARLTENEHAHKRRSVLDLAPLELACMNALWPMGQGTVREIRERLGPDLPRAYTTIMTIMDRLARKGIVFRQRAGRAWLYRPNLTAEDARDHAVAQVVDGFFGGSSAALAAQLSSPISRSARGASLQPPDSSPSSTKERRDEGSRKSSRDSTLGLRQAIRSSRIDETLL
jgi:BlaI family transcriptional regulator, penicillinase repressor